MVKSYAFFDFDGTLIPGDSIISFCFFARRKGLCSFGTLIRAGVMGAAYLCGLTTAKKSKEAALHFLKGKSETEMRAVAEAFCREVLLKKLFKEGREEIESLAKNGVEVWLVSASPSFYLEPLMDHLPLSAVIGTRFHTDENGVYTGQMAGENCRGIEKPLRIAEVLASRGGMVDYATSSAYGDTAGDAPMLALCEKKNAVNARAKLKKSLANEENVLYRRWK